MRRIADRRIHLRARAEALVAARRLEREMMRRHLDRSHVLVVGQKFHLLQRRDMQHVHSRAGLMSDCDKALGRLERGKLVTPDRMRARIAFDAQVFALAQADSSSAWKEARRRITFRTPRKPASSATSNEPVDEPMKTLMPATTGKPLELGQIFGVVAVAPTKKAKSQCMR